MSASFSLSLPGFAVTGHIDNQRNSRIFVSEVLPDGLAFNEGAYFHKNVTNKIGITNHHVAFLKRVYVGSQVCVQAMRSWCWMVGACGVWTWVSSKRYLLSKPFILAWGVTGLCPQLWSWTTRPLRQDSGRKFAANTTEPSPPQVLKPIWHGNTYPQTNRVWLFIISLKIDHELMCE